MNQPPPHVISANTAEESLKELLRLARYLRSPEGCPWDREQTTASFAHHLCGEAEELSEAVEGGDNAHIAEELGDTLFCTLMTAVVAEDEGRFGLLEALKQAYAKMIRRHGHLFGAHTAETPEEVAQVWKRIKADEKAERLR
ncbi:MAG TPA: nucleotide pyrophosphohydrolase [Candidatus Hydrogenedentes bacterium]|nr:nucleotide pyrophosphohydrolase [Candidatus Hydrogenedentota bacterium]